MKFLLTATLLFLVSAPYALAQDSSDGLDRPEVAKQINKYLSENFGTPGYETTWYRNIKDVAVRGDTVFTRTDLDDGDPKARNICGAVSGFVFDRTRAALKLNRVQVIGKDGKVLIDRNGVTELCREE